MNKKNNRNDSLGERMKRYEEVTRYKLMRRTPCIVRLDQRAGHTFTRGLVKPHDDVYIKTMIETMEHLCKEIQGCVFGYTQSDEITLVLIDYQELYSDAYFEYVVQKVVSTIASKCTRVFNKNFMENSKGLEGNERYSVYERKFWEAEFDCRAFNLPKEEVCNNILWRQQDAERNSIQGLAQSLFSHKQLQGLSSKMLQNKMFTEKGINWDEISTNKKRGTACKKNTEGDWVVDKDMPILKGDKRIYINETILL